MNPDLHAFVRDALARGASRDAISAALRAARWPDDEIASALAAWHDAGLGIPVPQRRMGVSPREAFLYLLMFVSLYLVAYHAGTVLFAIIDRAWPDPSFSGGPEASMERGREWVRFSVASLLVAFPVYLLTARITGSAVARDPEKRNSGVRRWLTYLTLFNAACVLIGDFIALLLNVLKGELTPRFMSKAAVVAAIAAWLFTHYLGGLRRDEQDAPPAARPSGIARLAGVAVVLVTLAGLGYAGSPSGARSELIDQRRLRELQQLATAVQEHYAQHHQLPATPRHLLVAGPHPGVAVLDPITHEPYGYVVLDSARFQVCGTFSSTDSVGPYGSQPDLFWRHGPGRACFEFSAPRARP